jgi:N-acetylmuramic acid 6-phosphate etherase
VADAVAAEVDAIAAVAEEVAQRLFSGGRLFYVGAGTSGRLGVLDAAECPPTFGTDPERVQGIIAGGVEALTRALEGAEDDDEAGRRAIEEAGVGQDDFVLGIAASGTTPFVRAALEAALTAGAGTGILSCSEPPGDLARRVGHRITPRTGPEAIVGSTRLKAGTATKLVLNTITTTAMVRLGKVYGNLMVDLRATSAKLVDRSLRIVETLTGLDRAGAETLLERAEGRTKTALAMHGMGVDRETAERRLADCGGLLGACLERYARGEGRAAT